MKDGATATTSSSKGAADVSESDQPNEVSNPDKVNKSDEVNTPSKVNKHADVAQSERDAEDEAKDAKVEARYAADAEEEEEESKAKFLGTIRGPASEVDSYHSVGLQQAVVYAQSESGFQRVRADGNIANSCFMLLHEFHNSISQVMAFVGFSFFFSSVSLSPTGCLCSGVFLLSLSLSLYIFLFLFLSVSLSLFVHLCISLSFSLSLSRSRCFLVVVISLSLALWVHFFVGVSFLLPLCLRSFAYTLTHLTHLTHTFTYTRNITPHIYLSLLSLCYSQETLDRELIHDVHLGYEHNAILKSYADKLKVAFCAVYRSYVHENQMSRTVVFATAAARFNMSETSRNSRVRQLQQALKLKHLRYVCMCIVCLCVGGWVCVCVCVCVCK
jgi:hypothetical protein